MSWITTAAACDRLGVSRPTLRALRVDGELAGVTPAAVDVSTGNARRPSWRWDGDRIEAWLREVSAWRRSESGMESGKSSGEIRTGRNGAKASERSGPRTATRGRSRTVSPREDGGSLRTLAKRLTSTK